MPFQKGNTYARRAKQQAPTAAGISGDRPDVQPSEMDIGGTDFANEMSAILSAPIIRGGVKVADADDTDDDDRGSYASQSYVNDPVHEEFFDTRARDAGPLSLPVEKLEIDGTEYRLGWVRCKIAGETDQQSLFSAMQDGWTAVPMDKLPSNLKMFAFKSDTGEGYYVVRDCILMMTPVALYNRRETRNQRAADYAMARVEQNVEFLNAMPKEDGIESRSKTPVRQQFTGRNATAAVQDALDRGEAPAPRARRHEIRGFRVR